MFRLVGYLLTVLLAAWALSWLAGQPGMVHVTWQNKQYDSTVFKVVVMLALGLACSIFIWSLLKAIWNSPAAFGERTVRRRQKRGLDAISNGMIAVGAGDKGLASQFALQARKALPHEPLTQLLRAQSAQLSGDRATARRIFEAMLVSPDTEQLGLRGLYLEAEHEGESEAARNFAERAMRANPKLAWSADAMFDHQCKAKDWARAIETLSQVKRHGNIDKLFADRKRAVLLTALAQQLEDSSTEKALAAALEAHTLAPEFIPPSAIAGRILASKGNTAKAAKVLQKTWAVSPHPDLATAYMFARIGDSTRDRLERAQQLAALKPDTVEGPLAIAAAAIDGRNFAVARQALQPFLGTRLTQRVAMMMARIEAADTGDKGRVQGWLQRAAHAGLDPVWIADGVISERWEPVSPLDGRLDAYEWRTPPDHRNQGNAEIAATRAEDLLQLAAFDPKEGHDATASAMTAHELTGARSGSENRTSEPEVSEPEVSVPVVMEPVTTVHHSRSPHSTASEVHAAAVNMEFAAPLKSAGAMAPGKSNGHGVGRVPAPLEPRLYISPRAPDDPGTGMPDDEADDAIVSVKRHF